MKMGTHTGFVEPAKTIAVTGGKSSGKRIGFKDEIPLPTRWTGSREIDFSVVHLLSGKPSIRFMQMGGTHQDVGDTRMFFNEQEMFISIQTVVFDLGQLIQSGKDLKATVKHDYIKAFGLSLLSEPEKKKALGVLKNQLAEGGILVEDSGNNTHPPTMRVWAKVEGTVELLTQGNLFDTH